MGAKDLGPAVPIGKPQTAVSLSTWFLAIVVELGGRSQVDGGSSGVQYTIHCRGHCRVQRRSRQSGQAGYLVQPSSCHAELYANCRPGCHSRPEPSSSASSSRCRCPSSTERRGSTAGTESGASVPSAHSGCVGLWRWDRDPAANLWRPPQQNGIPSSGLPVVFQLLPPLISTRIPFGLIPILDLIDSLNCWDTIRWCTTLVE